MTTPCPTPHASEQEHTLNIRVVPRSKKDQYVSFTEPNHLKIKIKAPPQDHKANDALITFLSDMLHLKKSQIQIVSGHQSRNKIIKIQAITKHALINQLRALI